MPKRVLQGTVVSDKADKTEEFAAQEASCMEG